MGPLCIYITQTKFIVVKQEREEFVAFFINANLIASLQLEFLLQQTTSSDSNSCHTCLIKMSRAF